MGRNAWHLSLLPSILREKQSGRGCPEFRGAHGQVPLPCPRREAGVVGKVFPPYPTDSCSPRSCSPMKHGANMCPLICDALGLQAQLGSLRPGHFHVPKLPWTFVARVWQRGLSSPKQKHQTGAALTCLTFHKRPHLFPRHHFKVGGEAEAVPKQEYVGA